MSPWRVLGIGELLDHNAWRFKAFSEIGCSVSYIDTAASSMGHFAEAVRLKAGLRAPRAVRNRIRRFLAEFRPDIVWVDKGLGFDADEVAEWRASPALVVQYHPDDWLNPIYSLAASRDAVSEYNAHVVPRPVMVTELLLAGARAVYKGRFAYEPTVHQPMSPRPPREKSVFFVGRADPDRVHLLASLAARGVPVTAVGPGFEPGLTGIEWTVDPRQPLGADYARVIQSASAAIGLLARQSRDQHTCRSVEIPASGGLLIAERTPEHQEMFVDGEEALLFDSVDELEFHSRRVLSDHHFAEKVSAAGRARVVRSRYDHVSEARRVLEFIESIR